jgi:hypothetical protein
MGETIHLPQDASLADLFAAVWGHLNASQGSALNSAVDREPDRPFGAALDFLASIGLRLVPTAPRFDAAAKEPGGIF